MEVRENVRTGIYAPADRSQVAVTDVSGGFSEKLHSPTSDTGCLSLYKVRGSGMNYFWDNGVAVSD